MTFEPLTDEMLIHDEHSQPYVDPEGTWEKFTALFPEVRLEPASQSSFSYHIMLGGRRLLAYADACRLYSFVKGALFAEEYLNLKSRMMPDTSQA